MISINRAIMSTYVELPDDTELITPGWVYANFESMGPQYSARQRWDVSGLVWENRFERFVLFGTPIPQVKTRGQLRMLVFVLAGVSDLSCPVGTRSRDGRSRREG